MALGRQLILERSDGAGGWEGVCVTESRSLTINNETIDITKPDCVNPGSKLVRSLQYSMQSMSFSGDGAFVNTAARKAVFADTVNQVVKQYRVTIPDVGTVVGDGLLTSGAFAGDKQNEMQNNFTIEFSGATTFTPAA